MIKSIIFDMDGVISDTQKIHAGAESDLLLGYGVTISPDEITRRYAGTETTRVFDELLRDQPRPYDVHALVEEKWKRIGILADQSIEEVDGSVELIEKLHGAGFRMAVASASNAQYVKKIIEGLNVRQYFEFLVSGDMVTRGKPDPEIFLLAAARLEVDPAHCVVIEDGLNGMRAARSANMKCIGLVGSREGEYPTENLVLSLREVTLEYLNNLL